jgi:phenylalanine-4-hydroxylase
MQHATPTENQGSDLLKITLCFSIKDKVGALEDCLNAIKAAEVSLTRIES